MEEHHGCFNFLKLQHPINSVDTIQQANVQCTVHIQKECVSKRVLVKATALIIQKKVIILLKYSLLFHKS